MIDVAGQVSKEALMGILASANGAKEPIIKAVCELSATVGLDISFLESFLHKGSRAARKQR